MTLSLIRRLEEIALAQLSDSSTQKSVCHVTVTIRPCIFPTAQQLPGIFLPRRRPSRQPFVGASTTTTISIPFARPSETGRVGTEEPGRAPAAGRHLS